MIADVLRDSTGPGATRDPVIDAYRAGLDLTLIEENLRLTPEERLLKCMELQRLAEELRRAGRDARENRG